MIGIRASSVVALCLRLLSFLAAASQDVAKLEEDLTVPHDSFQDICMEVGIAYSHM